MSDSCQSASENRFSKAQFLSIHFERDWQQQKPIFHDGDMFFNWKQNCRTKLRLCHIFDYMLGN